MGQLFGTDGVRGVAGQDLDARLATNLAAAAAHVLGGSRASDSARPRAVVGRDPRASGEFLEAAVVAGLAQSGTDVLRLGIIPTPGVAYLTDALGADYGVMLSASHNPAPDNGIKFFARGGLKLPDHVEDEIEKRMAASGGMAAPGGPGTGGRPAAGPGIAASGFGRVRDAAGDAERYLTHLLSTLASSRPLAGWRVVVDCAHGAAYALAPRLLAEAGADVAAILDGKYVLGGEQSGHIIMLDHSSTGDGMLTSLHLLATAAARGQSLAELAAVMTRFPQVLVNVHGVSKDKVAASGELAAAVADAVYELGESGRVLVRPSGTEPAVRVMVEAIDSGQAHKIADRLADVVRLAG